MSLKKISPEQKKTAVFFLTAIRPAIKVRALSRGAIAQLGERNTGSVEVGGSNPPGSTKFKPWLKGLRHCPHRLVGLGHRPFTAVTGVRIPLGTPLSGKGPR